MSRSQLSIGASRSKAGPGLSHAKGFHCRHTRGLSRSGEHRPAPRTPARLPAHQSGIMRIIVTPASLYNVKSAPGFVRDLHAGVLDGVDRARKARGALAGRHESTVPATSAHAARISRHAAGSLIRKRRAVAGPRTMSELNMHRSGFDLDRARDLCDSNSAEWAPCRCETAYASDPDCAVHSRG